MWATSGPLWATRPINEENFLAISDSEEAPFSSSVQDTEIFPTFPGDGESRVVCSEHQPPNRNSNKIMGRILSWSHTIESLRVYCNNLVNLFILKHLFLMSKRGVCVYISRWQSFSNLHSTVIKGGWRGGCTFQAGTEEERRHLPKPNQNQPETYNP